MINLGGGEFSLFHFVFIYCSLECFDSGIRTKRFFKYLIFINKCFALWANNIVECLLTVLLLEYRVMRCY